MAPPADGIACEAGRAGVFVWANDGPLAGEVATLLYNAASGPLRYDPKPPAVNTPPDRTQGRRVGGAASGGNRDDTPVEGEQTGRRE